MVENNMDNAVLGQTLILAAVSLDEALADLLKVEIKRLKQLSKEDVFFDETQKLYSLVRSIIMALTLTDEKIKAGMVLCKGLNQNKN